MSAYKTAIMHAVEYNDEASFRELLDAGAKISAVTDPLENPCALRLNAGMRTVPMYAAWHAKPSLQQEVFRLAGTKVLAEKDSNGDTFRVYLQKF